MMDRKTYFFYQIALDVLELKIDKSTDYILTWKSNGVYNSKRKPLCTTTSIKLSKYTMGIWFDKDHLGVKLNSYLNKNRNIFIVYALVAWPRNPIIISNLRIAYLKQLV